MKYFVYFSANYKENDCYFIVDEILFVDLIIVADFKGYSVIIKSPITDELVINTDEMRKLNFEIEFVDENINSVKDKVYNSLLNLSKQHEIWFDDKLLNNYPTIC